MEELKNSNIITLLSPVQKRQISILKKRQQKLQRQIDYIQKHGEEKVKLTVAKRQNTIAKNYNNKTTVQLGSTLK